MPDNVAIIAEIIWACAITGTPCDCVPLLARIAELEAENERLQADIMALLTGDFTNEDWERYRGALPA